MQSLQRRIIFSKNQKRMLAFFQTEEEILAHASCQGTLTQKTIWQFYLLPLLSHFYCLLKKYNHCFASDFSQLRVTNLVQLKINFKRCQSIFYRPYRKETFMYDLLKTHIIWESYFSFTSPVVVVKKKNGDYRFCVDYRTLNSNILNGRYLLPYMKGKIFHSLNMA